MRIIAGTARGMTLTMPKGPAIRPTPDRVKEAIFSSLGDLVAGARVLDLFSGTGALGLEAVSRGASGAVLVDSSRFSADAARRNAGKARLEGKVEVRCGNAFRCVDQFAADVRRFNLIFADPPYEKSRRPGASLARKLLNCPALVSILATDGILVLEHFKDDVVEGTGEWQLQRQLRHGETRVSFLRRKR